MNHPPVKRLETLEKYPKLVNYRDDLYLEHATLYNTLGQYEKAFELLKTRKFHPWEGGEGKVTGQYVFSLTEMAKKAIETKEFDKAVDLLNLAQHYPVPEVAVTATVPLAHSVNPNGCGTISTDLPKGVIKRPFGMTVFPFL